VTRVIVDVEYEGQEGKIRSFLLEYIRKRVPYFESETIVFDPVGKNSPADTKARAVRSGRDRRFRRVTSEELLAVLI
jgi:hypothetical protein